MKALTVQQPWAWAIVHGGKDVENRGRNIAGSYRGLLAIHAGLRTDDDGYYDDMVKDALARCDSSWVLQEQVEVTGAVVGVVDLVSVHHASDHGRPPCSWWAQLDQWHLMLANPRALAEPIPCRGALGLWTPTPDVQDAIGLDLAGKDWSA